MPINPSSKAEMSAAKSSSEPGASQGARRTTEEAPGLASVSEPHGPDMEVVPRARRRSFSNADKRRILAAADRCTESGAIGALLRREGVYSSSLSGWRRQRDAADLVALSPQKRGPKADPGRANALQIAQLTRERDHLRAELDKAQLVISVQKKVAALLALLEPDSKPESTS